MNKPNIGVTLDYSNKSTYAKTPWYALRQNYIQAFTQNEADVTLLHYEYSDLETLLNSLDGLVITGGDFDIDPKIYGENTLHAATKPNSRRTEFEYKLCKLAIDKKIPILGICGGHQLINVIMGGSLIQHLPDEDHCHINHEQHEDRHIPTHKVKIKHDSLLFDIVGYDEVYVNTTHHQAIRNVGNDLIISSVAEDGVIESIEHIDKSRCIIGVQWHPEYYHTQSDKKIINYFIKICQKTMNQ